MVFEPAVFRTPIMSASYPKERMRAFGSSLARRSRGQKRDLLYVHVVSRFPVRPWTKTILKEVSKKLDVSVRIYERDLYSIVSWLLSASVLSPYSPAVENSRSAGSTCCSSCGSFPFFRLKKLHTGMAHGSWRLRLCRDDLNADGGSNRQMNTACQHR